MPTLKLRDLAAAIEARLEGDPDASVSGVAPLERAGPGDLSFLANPRYEESAKRSGAAALIVGDSFHGNGRNLLRVANPYLAYARAVEILLPEAAPVPGIDPSAIVDPSASLGESVSIGPLVVIGGGARIGARTVIGAGSVVGPGVGASDARRGRCSHRSAWRVTFVYYLPAAAEADASRSTRVLVAAGLAKNAFLECRSRNSDDVCSAWLVWPVA